MRIRHDPNAKPELRASQVYIEFPEKERGRWRERFAESAAPLYLELGCGKGGFLAELSERDKRHNFIGIDLKSEMLVQAKRKIEDANAGAKRDNVRLTSIDIMRMSLYFAPEDSVSGIYINFCNPWPKPPHKKRRLTHIRQLRQYREIMVPEGFLQFKTDDRPLFLETQEYLKEDGWRLDFDSDDFSLQSFSDNIETEHERMYRREGKTIMGLIAKLR